MLIVISLNLVVYEVRKARYSAWNPPRITSQERRYRGRIGNATIDAHFRNNLTSAAGDQTTGIDAGMPGETEFSGSGELSYGTYPHYSALEKCDHGLGISYSGY